MAPRRRCPVCRSKQWHKEPSSGLIACSEGHVLQNYRNEAAEADDNIGAHALRKRTLNSGRKKKEKASRADPKLYHGARARYHYFQCLQLLLRKQIVALISLWNLPPEFEIVCRDIWTMHLSLLPNPPPPEPYFHLLETRGEMQTATRIVVSAVTKSVQPPPAGPNKHEEEDELKESSSSESSGEEEDNKEDPEIAELLRENSASDSSDDDDDDVVDPPLESSEPSTQRRKKASLSRYDSPASNVAVLMLACWTMRIPVACSDFRKIIELHELPYLDPIRLLPLKLTLHLTKHTTQMLSPYHAPRTLFLHSLVSRLAKIMHSSHGIMTPELNAAPILWRTVRCLGGTPILYKLTKRLAHILSLPLTLHYSLAPGLKQSDKRNPDSHKYDNVPPELAFLATCIIILKMVYGLDGKTRGPNTSSDPSCVLPTLKEYLALLKNLDDVDSKTKHAIFGSETQMSVADLTVPLTDEYLNFCAKALMRPKDEKTERDILEDYFPIETRDLICEDLATVSSYPRLSANHVSEENAVLPGQAYTIFKARDVLGTLPEEYELVVGRASRWAGVPEGYLCRVVERFERRIMRWWERQK